MGYKEARQRRNVGYKGGEWKEAGKLNGRSKSTRKNGRKGKDERTL